MIDDEQFLDPVSNQGVARLFDLIRRVSSSADPLEVMGEVAGGVLELGFGAVAVSEVDGTDIVVTHVQGPDGLEEAILGDRDPVDKTVELMESAEHWGILRYVRHDTVPQWMLDSALWRPDIEVSDDAQAWHPEDMLLAPLYSATGELLGTMGFDLPPGNVLPSEGLREMLEMYVVQAGLALSNARQRERLAHQVRLGETVKAVAMVSSLVGLDSSLHQVAELMTDGFSALQTWIRCFPDGDSGPSEHVAGFPVPNEVGAGTPTLREDMVHTVWPRGGAPVQITADQEDSLGLPRSRAELQAQMREHAVTHLVAAPIGVGQELLGQFVMVRRANPGGFDEAEMTAIGDIARELGRIVLNSRLYGRESRLVGELQEIDRYKSELIATISHELKTPLTSIIGHVELLDEVQLGATSVAAISRNAQRLDRLITNLLNYSSLQARRAHVRRQVDLEQLCRSSVDLLAFQAETAGISVTLVPATTPVVVSGDAEELGRIVDNLVGNAVKYSRRGGSVVVGASYDADAAVVTVTDTGLGISLVDQSHLFSAFHRSSNPDALSLPGTGLGLAISRRIAELHGGDIVVRSELGVGSTFSLRLPRSARLSSVS